MAYGVQPALSGGGLLGAGRHYMSKLWDGYDPVAIARTGGIAFDDEFLNMGSIIQNVTSTDLSGYGAFTSNNSTTLATAVTGANIQGGGLLLQTSADDNAEAVLVGGGGTSFPWHFVIADENDTWLYTHVARLRFETRFRVSSVANNDIAFAFGFTGVAPQTGFLAADSSALLSTMDFVGFRTLQASAATLQFTYLENGSTVQNLFTVGTIVANTWYKCGLDYDPLADPAERISIWFDSGTGEVRQNTFVTAAQMAASTFPFSNDATTRPLAVCFAAKNGSAVTGGAQFIASPVRIAMDPLIAADKEA